MIVSLKWLRDYIDVPLPTDELADRLTMAGLEVEGVHRSDSFGRQVLVTRLETIEKHPHADRLHLCRVSDGRRVYQVVCGAPDLREGSIVPLALPGTRLASGVTLQEAEIRGVLSQGMLCSQKELGVGEDASGIWSLPEDTPVGVPLALALDLDDVVLEIGVTPNRSDCLSILGVAREVAAICKAPLRYPEISLRENGPPIDALTSITVNDPIGCPRYAARVIQGISIGPSPVWLRRRLESVGLRSINNIVDVTNYVLMEMGQPLHAFDFDRLAENRIVVRRAVEGELFTTLDGVERTLFGDTVVICDARGPVAIAGIMGGLHSEIVPETRRVLIESAYFQPQSIRRSSKRLGLRTESSYRFERGIDPEGVLRALDRAAQLMIEVGGGELANGRIDVYPKPFEVSTLTLRVEKTNRFLGTQLSAAEMADVLQRIEMRVEEVEDDHLRVVPPSFRPDITREVDLTEEVVRLVGYDRVPVTMPEVHVQTASFDPHLRARQEVKEALVGGGFFEVLNYSFISQESVQKLRLSQDDSMLQPVRIMNPLSEEQAVMRTSLIPGLLQTARRNFDHGNDDLRIFELSKVFLPREGSVLPEESHHLGGMMSGKREPQVLYSGKEDVDYTDVKGVVENVLDLFYLEKVRFSTEDIPAYFDPRCAASIFNENERIGAVGRLHPEVEESFDLGRPVYAFEVDFERVFLLKQPHPAFRPLPRFPSVTRDMAIVVDQNVAAQDPLDFVLEQKEPLLEQVEIFDIYRSPQLGEHKASLGYRMVYRSSERNLTDEEVNEVHSRLVERVLRTFNATLR